jgi:hypothetical protein
MMRRRRALSLRQWLIAIVIAIIAVCRRAGTPPARWERRN